MNLYPAIDLKGGACVRLHQGDMRRVSVFSGDPAAQARLFAGHGFGWLHVVDLDRAVTGESRNDEAIHAILAATTASVQLGGGIRTLRQIGDWLERGVRRVILGTVAVRHPGLLAEAAQAFPGRVAVAIDTRDGLVATDGWTRCGTLRALDLLERFAGMPLAAIIHTDILRDGGLGGLDPGATLALARESTTGIIASGGVRDLADITRLREAQAECPRLEGLVIGRALYDGGLDPVRALAAARGEAPAPGPGPGPGAGA